ncbi:MAG: hypothetical protein LR006_00605, partial [Dehalococcoidia bacterium]|nr:hypothetical protein [Dehalococcoidia bacterium]
RGFVETDEWNFGSMLVTASPKAMEARFIGAQRGDQFVATSAEKEWKRVVPLGPGIEGMLQRFEELHRLLPNWAFSRLPLYPRQTPLSLLG